MIEIKASETACMYVGVGPTYANYDEDVCRHKLKDVYLGLQYGTLYVKGDKTDYGKKAPFQNGSTIHVLYDGI